MRLWLHVLAGNLGKMYIYIGEFWLNPFVSHFFFFLTHGCFTFLYRKLLEFD